VRLDALPSKLNDAIQKKQWKEKKGSLNFGTLLYQGHWFVPPAECLPDAPVNRLLKNNFWNGSHVWEWAVKDKSDFLPFFEKPALLQALSEGIAKQLPIQLASLSDKLGSIVLQVPVTCMVSEYRGTADTRKGVICNVNWHPDVDPRPLVITAERWHDGKLSHSSTPLESGDPVFLPAQDGPAGLKAVIRDSKNDVVLGAMEVNILNSIHIGMHIAHSERRTFTLKPEGTTESVTGNPNRLAHFDDTRKRIYREEMRVLRERREFVQYRPDDQDENGQQLDREQRHSRALNDIRYLIKRHGRKAVWLWDPYLNASDILNTLFYNPHGEAAMRALTGAQQIKEVKDDNPQLQSKQTKKKQFMDMERDRLKQQGGNLASLRLEFRAKAGKAGFAFHDRFLIFPHAEPEPLAWSLGISVNSVGKEHHILQKVPNGRLIADAFQDLWDDLDQLQKSPFTALPLRYCKCQAIKNQIPTVRPRRTRKTPRHPVRPVQKANKQKLLP